MARFKLLAWDKDEDYCDRWSANGLNGSYRIAPVRYGVYRVRLTPWDGLNREHGDFTSIEEAKSVAQEENDKAVQSILNEWLEPVAP